jgi:prepilin-type processing-associated H-X9-DG protein
MSLGNNRKGQPIGALAMDMNFLCPPTLAAWGVKPVTQHGMEFVNVLYADGSAVSQANADRRLTIDLSNPQLWLNPMLNPFDNILTALENADGQP